MNVKCDICDPPVTAGTGLSVREEMREGTSNGGLHELAQTDKFPLDVVDVFATLELKCFILS
jgi:hypothetical protein